MSLWFLAAVAAAIYCLARGIIDMRARSYGWGLIGIASAFVILAMPYPPHVVTIRLPVGTSH